MEIGIEDLIVVAVLIVVLVWLYFIPWTKVTVLEERVENQSEDIERLSDALERIEAKLDSKVDR